MVVTLDLLSIMCLPFDRLVVIMHCCVQMQVTSLIRQDFPLRFVRRDEPRILSTFRTMSKYRNLQNEGLVYLLFCSTLECHTLGYQSTMLSIMILLME